MLCLTICPQIIIRFRPLIGEAPPPTPDQGVSLQSMLYINTLHNFKCVKCWINFLAIYIYSLYTVYLQPICSLYAAYIQRCAHHWTAFCRAREATVLQDKTSVMPCVLRLALSCTLDVCCTRHVRAGAYPGGLPKKLGPGNKPVE